MTKNVILAATLPAPPERLFDMYLDSRTHSEFTGAHAMIGSEAGAEFQAFDGALTGKMLHIEPKKMIVQTWRSSNWPEGSLDSILTLSFWPDGESARIELAHINVPLEDFAGVSEGWEKYYWIPWRRFLMN